MNSRFWHIVLNPRAGRNRASKRRGELEKLLDAAKLDWRILDWRITETSRGGEATEIARRIISESGKDFGLAAAGGDGTLGEVLNGVMQSEKEIPLAVLPMGTGNDFARALRISNLRDAVDNMRNGVATRIDIGEVKTDSHRQFFLNIAGCGLDAVVAKRINDDAAKRGFRLRGTPAYIATIVKTLGDFRGAKLSLELDGEKIETRAMLCAIANARSYGGGMRVAPRALLDDGFFDICLVGDATRIEFLRAFPSVFKGTHESHPKVQTWRAKNVRIESAVPLPVLADGELVGTTPLEITILPRAATMMIPATSGAIVETARRK